MSHVIKVINLFQYIIINAYHASDYFRFLKSHNFILFFAILLYFNFIFSFFITCLHI
jgi:hypothetical protein